MDFGYKKRSDLHLIRKVWHAGAVMVLFYIWNFFESPYNKNLIYLLTILFIIGDILRVYVPLCNKIFNKVFSLVLRKSEVHRFAGTTYLLTGVSLIAFLFPHSVVSLSILFLAFADPIASYVGIKYGTKKIVGQKSIEGFLAAFVVCSVLATLFLVGYYSSISMLLAVIIAVSAGLIGAFAELLPIGSVDDNLTMPIISAMGLYLLFTFILSLP